MNRILDIPNDPQATLPDVLDRTIWGVLSAKRA
jgi:hypothetical protein